MINIKKGNLFDYSFDAIVNTVNCVGVMGKGIAKQFKVKYPEYFSNYKEKCNKNLIKVGKCDIYIEYRGPIIISFPTKIHWKNPSEINWIKFGLYDLKNLLLNLNIKTIGIPALGCNNGGLPWIKVKKLMLEILDNIPIEITIFEPLEN